MLRVSLRTTAMVKPFVATVALEKVGAVVSIVTVRSNESVEILPATSVWITSNIPDVVGAVGETL